MNSIIKKFTALFAHEKEIYVNAARVNDHYKKIVRGSTQATLIGDLKLDYIIVIRRGKGAGSIINIRIDDDKFKSSTMNVFIKMSQLKRHKELMKRIKALPDINEEEYEFEVAYEAEEEKDQQEKVDETFDNDPLDDIPIIQLKDHELFRDVNGEVFDVEVRGERTRDKFLLKAKDIAEFFGMDRMVDCLLRTDRSEYKLNEDYVIVRKTQSRKIRDCEILNESTRIDHNRVYLTFAGFIRVVFVSKSGNANVKLMLDWILNLIYVHKFGSDEERLELSQDLLKVILNDKVSGLYYVDLGTFDDLYKTMNISMDEYPQEKYGSHRIGKFGLSEDVSSRLTSHKNKKNGYGRWSKDVGLKWMIILSPSQLSSAETLLSNLLKAGGFSFNHKDVNDTEHTELIMFEPSKELRVKKIYKQVLSLYPNKENELAQAIEEHQAKYEVEMAKQSYDYEMKLKETQQELTKQAYDYEMKLKETEHRVELNEVKFKHKIEVLELQLQIEKMKIQNN